MGSFGGSQAPTLMKLPPPQAVNPQANALWNQLFLGTPSSGGSGGPSGMVPKTGAPGGGTPGAGEISINALEGMASGVDIQSMIDTLVKSSQNQYKTGAAQIQNAFAASGMGLSSDLMKSLSDYNVNFGAQQDQAVSDLILKGKGLQLGAATTLEETFSNAALNFAPSAQVVGGAQNSNVGSSLVGTGSEIGTLAVLAAIGFL